MDNAPNSNSHLHRPVMEAFAAYLELSVDLGASIVVMAPDNERCSVKVGNPFGASDDLTQQGTLSKEGVDDILKQTQMGLNIMEIEGQTYRFTRTYRQYDEKSAVIFSPA